MAKENGHSLNGKSIIETTSLGIEQEIIKNKYRVGPGLPLDIFAFLLGRVMTNPNHYFSLEAIAANCSNGHVTLESATYDLAAMLSQFKISPELPASTIKELLALSLNNTNDLG